MKVLIVDDNKFIRDVVSSMVIDSGHKAFCASGHKEALELIASQPIDIVLMDIEMPEVDGFELTRQLRATTDHWFPIIFLSSNDSEDYIVKGIDAGGDDYLTKPVKQVILSAKIKAMERIADMQRALDEANQRLAKLGNIDELTQLANRRGMDQFLTNAWQVNARQNADMSLLMIDIDYFKQYNDHYGHQAGDNCLKQVAEVLRATVNRASDGVFRYGGEEFTIVLPFTPVEGARFKAKEILNCIEQQAIAHEFSSIRNQLTLSIGIATSDNVVKDVNQLIGLADQALYRAKDSGRNRYYVYQAR